MMNTVVELEAEKALLARQILCIDDENMIHNIRLFLKDYKPDAYRLKMPERRQIGILNGKAKIVFKDDFEMTTEELLGLE